jgi:hypothetical protein
MTRSGQKIAALKLATSREAVRVPLAPARAWSAVHSVQKALIVVTPEAGRGSISAGHSPSARCVHHSLSDEIGCCVIGRWWIAIDFTNECL